MERIHQYLEIEHEPKPTESGVPPAYWPASGDLRVEKLSARYSAVSSLFRAIPCSVSLLINYLQDGPKVLHELDFEIKSGEHIGIGMSPMLNYLVISLTICVVGRTGSGKVRYRGKVLPNIVHTDPYIRVP